LFACGQFWADRFADGCGTRAARLAARRRLWTALLPAAAPAYFLSCSENVLKRAFAGRVSWKSAFRRYRAAAKGWMRRWLNGARVTFSRFFRPW
jgi:hypothetical protein